ncbi:hypothetical protein BC826DRAFT_643792 [Russula brevipes]|nr:hypothetical protein BC826DRAFT_643792 [Russula brevipes]
MPGQRGPSIWLQGRWPLKAGTYTTEYFNPSCCMPLMWTVVDSDSLSSGVPPTPAVGATRSSLCLLPFGASALWRAPCTAQLSWRYHKHECPSLGVHATHRSDRTHIQLSCAYHQSSWANRRLAEKVFEGYGTHSLYLRRLCRRFGPYSGSALFAPLG